MHATRKLPDHIQSWQLGLTSCMWLPCRHPLRDHKLAVRLPLCLWLGRTAALGARCASQPVHHRAPVHDLHSIAGMPAPNQKLLCLVTHGLDSSQRLPAALLSSNLYCVCTCVKITKTSGCSTAMPNIQASCPLQPLVLGVLHGLCTVLANA